MAEPKSWWAKRMIEEWERNPKADFIGGNTLADACEIFEGETMAVWDFCGCGRPGVVVKNMAAYLRARADSPPSELRGREAFDKWYEGWESRHPIQATDAYVFCGYLAAAAEWTEHGGSVDGAWLTDAGRDWLDQAEEWERLQAEERAKLGRTEPARFQPSEERILPTPEPSKREGWERVWASGHWLDDDIWAEFLELPGMHIIWELNIGGYNGKTWARGAAKTLEIAHSRAERAAVLLKQVWKLEGERDEDKPYYRALPHFNLVKGA